MTIMKRTKKFVEKNHVIIIAVIAGSAGAAVTSSIAIRNANRTSLRINKDLLHTLDESHVLGVDLHGCVFLMEVNDPK